MSIFDRFKSPRVKRLEAEVDYLTSLLTPEHNIEKSLSERIADLEEDEKYKKDEIKELENKIQELKNEVEVLSHDVKQKEKQIIVLDQEILFQELGLYEPVYDFATSEEYKANLELIRKEQKEMMKEKTAVSYYENWTLDGSLSNGRKFTHANIKHILRTFNNECEYMISKVTFSNIEVMRKRIEKSFEDINRMNEINRISIKPKYLGLKIKELQLAYEYQLKKQIEKDEARRQRQLLHEQLKIEQELKLQRKNIEKDKNLYLKALEQVRKDLQEICISEMKRKSLVEKEINILAKLETIDEKIADIDYRQENQRAGYVYIISNIGSYGKDVYKIGMSRRLDPQERVDELGRASVPYPFDVHAMIFSDDAPRLEYTLHRAFEKKKINLVNRHKEFFRVTLEEIENEVKKNFDKTVSFSYIPEAQEYRESLAIREKIEEQSKHGLYEI